MYRQIIIPESNRYLLDLPQDFVGKKVEVIAFTVENEDKAKISGNAKKQFGKLLLLNLENPVILPEGYEFNRNELYE